MNNSIECFAIILIIVAVSLIYLRAGKKVIALSVLPIASVPIFHCVAWLIKANFFSQVSTAYQAYNLYLVFDVIGLGVGLLLCGLCANGFRKKAAVIYLSVVALFDISFTAILMFNNLQLILDK